MDQEEIVDYITTDTQETETFEEEIMTTTTSYGTWYNLTGVASVEASMIDALGEWVNEFDVDNLIADYRNAINDALPAGFSLHGNEFYGPHPIDEDVDLEEIVARVDHEALLGILRRHDLKPRD